jgi:hypothetical protein
VRETGGTPNMLLPSAPGDVRTPTGNTADCILGGHFTVSGADWAMAPGGSPFSIQPFAAYTNDAWASGNHTTVESSSTPAADSLTASLCFNAPAGHAVTLSEAVSRLADEENWRPALMPCGYFWCQNNECAVDP